jgi:hypothetical protein
MARGFETTTGLVIQQGLFEESLTAKHKVGTRMQLVDGRVFYYAKAGGTLSAGKLCASVVTLSGHEDVDTSAQSIGDKEVTVTLNTTAATADLYAEGWISTRETGGVGQMLKIKSHPVQAATTGTVVLTLYDPVTTALLSTGQADLMQNPFMDVIVAATTTEPAAGIPLIPVTNNYFAWLQTWGPAACLVDTTAALGSDIAAGVVDGSIEAISTETNDMEFFAAARVGHTIGAAGADAKYTAIMLQLFP